MFIPHEGTILTVTLPGELLRAPVVRVINSHTVFVQLGQPLTKNHIYRKDDLVACERKDTPLGEVWEAVDERVLWARTQAAKEPELPVARKARRKKASA